jgi:hypothetical protein
VEGKPVSYLFYEFQKKPLQNVSDMIVYFLVSRVLVDAGMRKTIIAGWSSW